MCAALPLLLQIQNELNAGLGSWVPKGMTVTPAYVGLLENDTAMMSYLDGGIDMEAMFDVSALRCEVNTFERVPLLPVRQDSPQLSTWHAFRLTDELSGRQCPGHSATAGFVRLLSDRLRLMHPTPNLLQTLQPGRRPVLTNPGTHSACSSAGCCCRCCLQCLRSM